MVQRYSTILWNFKQCLTSLKETSIFRGILSLKRNCLCLVFRSASIISTRLSLKISLHELAQEENSFDFLKSFFL